MQTSFAKALVLAALTAAVVLISGGNAMAQDGKALYMTKGCMACHGADGKAPIMPVYPKIAGQNAAYIEQQLNDFKTNKRTNGQSALMLGMTAPLTPAEIKALAAYLSAVK